MIKDVIAGSGSFQVTVQLLNGTSPLPHNYSLSPQELVVVEVSVNTSSEHIKVIANKCWVTPSPNSADTYSYTFLENRSASCYPTHNTCRWYQSFYLFSHATLKNTNSFLKNLHTITTTTVQSTLTWGLGTSNKSLRECMGSWKIYLV